jgi:Methyltransferase domain
LDLPRNLLEDRMKGQMISSDVNLARMNASLVGEEWQGTPEAAKIVQLWGDSLHFDFTGLGPFNLIYVDGSHAEPWVARDTENAFAPLAPTGAILWDDCFWHDVLSVLGRSGRHQPIYLFENGSTAGCLQIDGKAVSVS